MVISCLRDYGRYVKKIAIQLCQAYIVHKLEKIKIKMLHYLLYFEKYIAPLYQTKTINHGPLSEM